MNGILVNFQNQILAFLSHKYWFIYSHINLFKVNNMDPKVSILVNDIYWHFNKKI